MEVGKRTRVGKRPSHALFFVCFLCLVGGEYKLRNWDGHYRRYVAAKLHSDDINTRIVGKEVQVKALPCCVSIL